MFVSISDSLPKTSYVKMIDIWLLFSLSVPFLMVVLHTVIDTQVGGMVRDSCYGRGRVVW